MKDGSVGHWREEMSMNGKGEGKCVG